MAKTSYPNQDMVTIHKEPHDGFFLQVGKDEWMSAYADLTPGTFGLYLYLCGNQNGFRMGLSSIAVQNALGYSDSTYRRAKKELKEKGYLVVEGSSEHVLEFYPTPQCAQSKMSAAAAPVTADLHASAAPKQVEVSPRFPSSRPVVESPYGWQD